MKSYCFHITLLLSILCTSWCQGQNNGVLSEQGYFEVDFVKGCSPLAVEVTYNNPPSEIKQIRFEDNVPFDTVLTHTYETPGTYKIEALFGESPNIVRDSLIVTVKEPTAPYFEVFNCGNHTLSVQVFPQTNGYDSFKVEAGGLEETAENRNNYSVEFTLDPSVSATTVKVTGLLAGPGFKANCGVSTKTVQVYPAIEAPSLTHLQATIFAEGDSVLIGHQEQGNIDYILEYALNGSSSYQEVQEIRGSETRPSEFIPLDLQGNFYCFRGKTRNPCNENEALFSEPICTVKLQVSPGADGNQVAFETASTASQPTAFLLRKSPTQTSYQQIHSFGPSPEGSYLDSLIDCSTPYQYAIRLDYASGVSSLTEGLPISNETQRTLPAPANIVSNWQDASIVEFSLPELRNQADINLKAFRADNSNKLVNEADTNFIQLPAAGTNTCYRFQYIDACGNQSALSEPVCAIYLRNTATQPDELLLKWNAYEGYADGVARYELVKYSKDGGNTIGRTDEGLMTSTDLGTQELSESGMQYQIVANPHNLNIPPSTSNRFVFEIEMKGYFPNAFTPNGDNQNDTFTPKGKFISSLHLLIFNRWGEQVFETKDKETGWDGIINGSHAPTGPYIYRARVQTADGLQQTYQGTVFLLRR